MFEGRDLSCIRGERVLFTGLDFRLQPGDICLVTGPNGSGKSSLLRLMAGLLRPAAGTLLWNGAPLGGDRDDFLSETHYVGHLDAVKPALTAAENLAFWARLRGGGNVLRALAAFGIAGLRDLPARFLSAGQKRRLTLARLAGAPARLWLLDEPTVALDPAGVRLVEQAILAHRAGGGIAVISTNVPIALPEVLRIELAPALPPADPDLPC